MAIHVEILTQLDDRRARADAERLRADLTRAGRDAGDGWGREYGRGVERSTPAVQRAMNRVSRATDKVADATGRVRTEQERYNRVMRESANDSQKVVAASERSSKAKRDEAAASSHGADRAPRLRHQPARY
jgi:methyl-accepting chemotaxis protein